MPTTDKGEMPTPMTIQKFTDGDLLSLLGERIESLLAVKEVRLAAANWAPEELMDVRVSIDEARASDNRRTSVISEQAATIATLRRQSAALQERNQQLERALLKTKTCALSTEVRELVNTALRTPATN